MSAENAVLGIDKFHEVMARSNEAVSLKNKLLGLTYNNLGCLYKQ